MENMSFESNATSYGPRQFVSIAWIADRWSCSRPTVRRLLHRAGVPPVRITSESRTVRFPLEEVLAVEVRARTRRPVDPPEVGPGGSPERGGILNVPDSASPGGAHAGS